MQITSTSSRSDIIAVALRRFLAFIPMIVGFLVFGFATLIAIIWHGPRPDASPSCGDDVMAPGDVCRETYRGVTNIRTYAEKLHEATKPIALNRPIWIVVALLGMALMVGTVLVNRRTQQRRARVPG